VETLQKRLETQEAMQETQSALSESSLPEEVQEKLKTQEIEIDSLKAQVSSSNSQLSTLKAK